MDRCDNDAGYSPSNCRWTTSKENNRNRRDTRRLSAFGETKTLIEWSEDPRCPVSIHALRLRLDRRGWPAEKAITTPKMKSRSSFV